MVVGATLSRGVPRRRLGVGVVLGIAENGELDAARQRAVVDQAPRVGLLAEQRAGAAVPRTQLSSTGATSSLQEASWSP